MIELTKKDDTRFTEFSYDQHCVMLKDLMSENIVLNYAESENRARFWIILEAASESEVIDILSDLPILKFLKLKIIPLHIHISSIKSPSLISMN